MQSACSNVTGPRLLIADDHPIFAESLRLYLEKTCTVAEAMRLRPDGDGCGRCQVCALGLNHLQ
jgi:hypothetical protein